MLSSVLRSQTAIKVNREIMRDLDDIYLALSQLAGKIKDMPKESERKRIGYK
jgi:hypothetical protein